MPDDHLPDPDDTADFELPDQQALIDAFTAGLCKESQHDFRSLSTLLATLPDPSLRLSVMDMSRLKQKLCRSAAAHRAGPSAGPPPDGVPRRGVCRRADRRAGLLRPGHCARNGAARPGALQRHEIQVDSG